MIAAHELIPFLLTVSEAFVVQLKDFVFILADTFRSTNKKDLKKPALKQNPTGFMPR